MPRVSLVIRRTKSLALALVTAIFMTNAVSASPVDQNNDNTLIFGFLPILSTEKLVARFGPLVDYLSAKLGQPIRLETAPDYTEFMHRTNREKRYDLLFTAPHFYYLAQRKSGYRVIVRVDAPSMHAVIVAPKASSIKTLADLRGHRISTPDQLALGTVLIRHTLQKAGLDPDKDVTLVATPSHNASLLSAYKGITDAAGLMVPPYKLAAPKVRESMQILAQTQGTPHMPISVAPTLSMEQVRIVEEALLSLNQSKEGRALLKHLSWPGFAKSTPQEYDAIGWAVEQLKK
jgi:phosphonate transport system substrate-binding protein